MFAYCSGAGSSPIFMHRPNILAYVGKWSFISELANIYIKENTKRCPLCIDLLFLSLKMKLWHITKTSLDFAKIPLCTQWISLRAQAAPSTCSVQRRREQLQLPQPDLLTPLPLEPPTAAGVAVSQNCGGSRRHNCCQGCLDRDGSCVWKRQINSTCILYLSSLIFICRILKWRSFLNTGICFEWPRHGHVDIHADTYMCTHSFSYLLHMDSKESWRILWSLSIQWL